MYLIPIFPHYIYGELHITHNPHEVEIPYPGFPINICSVTHRLFPKLTQEPFLLIIKTRFFLDKWFGSKTFGWNAFFMSLLNCMNLKLYFLYSSIDAEGVVLEDIFPGCLESAIETSMLTGFGMMGQSWDTYSDMGLAYELATGTYTPKQGKFDIITVFSWIFISHIGFHCKLLEVITHKLRGEVHTLDCATKDLRLF